MTLAAARLGASRSAVSQQITNLEETLGAPLFDRTERPMVLTPVGAVLRRHAHQILEAVSAARTELMEISLSALAELRLGIIDDLDASITPELVSHLQSLYPRCQLSVNSGRSDSLTSGLVKRLNDVVLSGILPDDMSNFEDYPILRESFIIAAAKGVLSGGSGLRQQLEAAPIRPLHLGHAHRAAHQPAPAAAAHRTSSTFRLRCLALGLRHDAEMRRLDHHHAALPARCRAGPQPVRLFQAALRRLHPDDPAGGAAGRARPPARAGSPACAAG